MEGMRKWMTSKRCTKGRAQMRLYSNQGMQSGQKWSLCSTSSLAMRKGMCFYAGEQRVARLHKYVTRPQHWRVPDILYQTSTLMRHDGSLLTRLSSLLLFAAAKSPVSCSYLLSPWVFWFCWFPAVCRSGILAKSSCSESPKTRDNTTIRPSLSRANPTRGTMKPQVQ